MKNILVTGAAGFIGANLVLRLLDSSEPLHIVGLDNMNSYYDPSLKEYRLRQIEEKAQVPCSTWAFVYGNIADRELVNKLFADYRFDIVVNLAAQAGVRYSIENPDAYIESNIIGFYNILEACRHYPVEHLVYASSSSVYGGNKKVPFSNYGNCRRDFTYVDDIVEGITRVMAKAPKAKVPEPVEGPTTTLTSAHYAIYNIGGGQPENLLDFVNILQEELVRAGVLPKDYDFESHKQLVPMQPGDVPTTYADATALERDFGFTPKIPLREGLRKFAEWYREFYMKLP